MAKTNSTSKQSNKKQPSDCHCNEKSTTSKSKANKPENDSTDCK